MFSVVIAGVAGGEAETVPIGVDDHIDEVGIVEGCGRLGEAGLVEGASRLPFAP